MPAQNDRAFYGLLTFYGVPPKIIKTLQNYEFSLPEPYAETQLPPSLKTCWLFLHGPTGSGKSTHAAYLLAQYLRGKRRLGGAGNALRYRDPLNADYDPKYLPKGSKVNTLPFYRYVRVTDLLRKMKEDFNRQSNPGAELFQSCLTAEFLVLDDLTNAPSAWELSQLDLLIDKRYGDESRTIITSNHNLEQLSDVLGSERITGRIGEIAHTVQSKGSYR